jgi:hypothetical protein
LRVLGIYLYPTCPAFPLVALETTVFEVEEKYTYKKRKRAGSVKTCKREEARPAEHGLICLIKHFVAIFVLTYYTVFVP